MIACTVAATAAAFAVAFAAVASTFAACRLVTEHIFIAVRAEPIVEHTVVVAVKRAVITFVTMNISMTIPSKKVIIMTRIKLNYYFDLLQIVPFFDSKLNVEPKFSSSFPFYAYGYQSRACYDILL